MMKYFIRFFVIISMVFIHACGGGKDRDELTKLIARSSRVVYESLIYAKICDSVENCKKKDMVYGESESGTEYKTIYGLESEERYKKVSSYIDKNFYEEGVVFCFYLKDKNYYLDKSIVYQIFFKEADYCQGGK
jgi:hypothetical protein